MHCTITFVQWQRRRWSKAWRQRAWRGFHHVAIVTLLHLISKSQVLAHQWCRVGGMASSTPRSTSPQFVSTSNLPSLLGFRIWDNWFVTSLIGWFWHDYISLPAEFWVIFVTQTCDSTKYNFLARHYLMYTDRRLNQTLTNARVRR